MKAFLEVLRQAMTHRATIGFSVFCSLMAGLLWGANIGTLYPVLDVVFRGESLGQSAERNIEESRQHITRLKEEIRQIENQMAADPASRDEMQAKLNLIKGRVDAEQRSLAKWNRIEPFAEKFLPADPMATLLLVIGFLLGCTLLRGVFVSLHETLVSRITLHTMFDLRKRFYRRAMRWDLASFTEERSSRLLSRFTHDLPRVGEGLQAIFGRALHEPVKIVVCLCGAAFICWRLLLVSLICAPLGFLIIRAISRAARRNADDEMSAMSDVYAHLAETFRGIKMVLAFNRSQKERLTFHQLTKKLLRRRLRAAAYRSLIKPTGEILSMAMISIAIVIGAYLVINRETRFLGITICSQPIGATTLILFYAFLLGASEPIKKLSGISIQLIRSASAAERITKLMNREPAIRNPDHPVPYPIHPKKIVLDNVKFRYRRGENVLHNINLEIGIGERIALIGPNGCGKSTLINLIARFYDPKQGSIKIDDTNICDFRVEELRRQIAIVSQEVLLFDDTVLNNIRYGQQFATDEQVISAAKQAGAHDFISLQLTDGYQTIIGEDGCMLSGGQRQRLALARACLCNARIWILDEATNSVDAAAVNEFRERLSLLLRDRTAIIITHRATDLVLADRVVVMDSGRIIDVGTRMELLGRCESFQRFHQTDADKAA